MSFQRKPKTINPDDVDPSIYYYDEVYDDMQQTRDDKAKTDERPKQKQQSRYIQGIIETAERRKSEKEIRKFKKYARDREEAQTTGALHDEEVYVTKSYEMKLQEISAAIEKHAESDDGRTLNLFKRIKRQDIAVKQSRERRTSNESATKTNDKTRYDSPDTSKQHHSSQKGSASNPKSDKMTKMKRPQTIEKRREYLREILAKRTVGQVFTAAQERYQQRKAIK